MAAPNSTSVPQSLDTNRLYDRDYYGWLCQQADALSRRTLDAVDWDNVTAEIEALVRQEQSALGNHYTTIMQHFLKLQYRHSSEIEPVRGWLHTVHNARDKIELLFHRNPSLATHSEKLFAEAWPTARKQAIRAFVNRATERIQDVPALLREQKRLTREWSRLLPQKNPYTRRQCETPDWFPDLVPLPQRPRPGSQPNPEIGWTR